MTLKFPTLTILILKITFHTAEICDNKFQEIQASLFWEILAWLFYIFSNIFGIFVGPSVLILHDVILAPTYAWKLIWQPNGRSIFNMLRDPCGHNNEKQKNNKRKWRHSNKQRPHPRPWRRGFRRLRGAHIGQTQEPIVGYDSSLCMFSYYQMDRENMNRCENHGDTKDGSSQIIQVQAMEFTYYYASIYFEAVKIFFLKKPKEPPRGCITSLLVGAFIIGIFSCLTMIGIARMTFRSKTFKQNEGENDLLKPFPVEERNADIMQH